MLRFCGSVLTLTAVETTSKHKLGKSKQKMQKIPKQALSLKQFMLRQEVLKLYRDIFRTIRRVPDEHSRAELRSWARHDFQMNRHQTEELAIKMLLQHGQRSLKELQTSLELSGVTKK